MKTFSTIIGAFNFIKRHVNTGTELIMNDSIHFGVSDSVYIYSTDVDLYNLADLKPENKAFTSLLTDEHLKRAISYELQAKGFIYVK